MNHGLADSNCWNVLDVLVDLAEVNLLDYNVSMF